MENIHIKYEGNGKLYLQFQSPSEYVNPSGNSFVSGLIKLVGASQDIISYGSDIILNPVFFSC